MTSCDQDKKELNLQRHSKLHQKTIRFHEESMFFVRVCIYSIYGISRDFFKVLQERPLR
jgi:hypothetical protein